ncbi:hypothetical protein ES708_33466 [subsurface metagenome]
MRVSILNSFTFDGCKFLSIDPPTYDVYVGIGASNIVTMTNYTNDHAGAKDAELDDPSGTTGEVYWGGGPTIWTGTVDNDWHNNGNWTNHVPDASINASITPTWTGPITITAAAACANLTFKNDSQVILQSDDINYGLTISGTLIVTDTNLFLIASGTTVTCRGNVYVGSAAAGSGVLELKPDTTLLFDCPAAGDYGLIVDAYSTMIETGIPVHGIIIRIGKQKDSLVII